MRAPPFSCRLLAQAEPAGRARLDVRGIWRRSGSSRKTSRQALPQGSEWEEQRTWPLEEAGCSMKQVTGMDGPPLPARSEAAQALLHVPNSRGCGPAFTSHSELWSRCDRWEEVPAGHGEVWWRGCQYTIRACPWRTSGVMVCVLHPRCRLRNTFEGCPRSQRAASGRTSSLFIFLNAVLAAATGGAGTSQQ